MMEKETGTDLGTIHIHHDVIVSIANIAAMEIEGVARIGSNLTSRIYTLLGKKNASGIKVEIDKNDEIRRIEVPLVVKYGYYIKGIAENVQENIRSSVEKMTDSVIRDINIYVQGIERSQK